MKPGAGFEDDIPTRCRIWMPVLRRGKRMCGGCADPAEIGSDCSLQKWGSHSAPLASTTEFAGSGQPVGQRFLSLFQPLVSRC